MNKREFTKIIKDSLKDVPLEKQHDVLFTYKGYLQSVHNDLLNKLSKLIRCNNCGKYFKDNKKTHHSKKEVSLGECVYRDCGYGDDDEFADILYEVMYTKCPFCNADNEVRRFEISRSNVRTRC